VIGKLGGLAGALGDMEIEEQHAAIGAGELPEPCRGRFGVAVVGLTVVRLMTSGG